VPEKGIETSENVLSTRTPVSPRANEPPPVDASARPLVAVGPSETHAAPTRSGAPPTVEDALAEAVTLAARAERWDVVVQLGEELRARRLAAADVVHLGDERARRERGR
jgi:hypothetical protein